MKKRIVQTPYQLPRIVRMCLLMAVVFAATACIFEQSDYQGGGRLDNRPKKVEEDTTDSGPPPNVNVPDTDMIE